MFIFYISKTVRAWNKDLIIIIIILFVIVSKYAIDWALTCVCLVSQPPAAGGAPVWAVSAAEQVQYRDLFVKTDTDMDGFVDGGQLREIIMKSGLPQNILAHIW